MVDKEFVGTGGPLMLRPMCVAVLAETHGVVYVLAVYAEVVLGVIAEPIGQATGREVGQEVVRVRIP